MTHSHSRRLASIIAVELGLLLALAGAGHGQTPPKPDLAGSMTSAAASSLGMQMAEKTIAALGGDAFVNQTSAVLKGSARLFVTGDAIPLKSLTVFLVYPDKVHAEFDLGQDHISLYENGNTGWVMVREDMREIPASEIQNNPLIYDAALRRLRSGGTTARALDNAEVAGKPARAFAVSDAEGRETRFYVDPTTLLPVKVGFGSPPDIYEITLADYRDVSGVRVPFHVERWQDGAMTDRIMFTEAQINVPIDPKLFVKPSQ